MLRLTLAVATSYLILQVLVLATRVALVRLFFHTTALAVDPDAVTPAFLLANAVANLVYAVIAGCIAAALGRKHEAPTVLGALLLGMAVGSLVMNWGGFPLWYAAVIPVSSAVAATVAGYTWLGPPPAALKQRTK